ncbi:MAG: hypothetical protein ACK41D_00605 [Rubricoccaceae bacterium]
MASEGNRGARLAIQFVLGLVIVGLAVLLYRSIVLPWRAYEQREAVNAEARARMDGLRQALIAHRDAYQTYPGTLDSLLLFMRTDTVFAARRAELTLPIDSLAISPRARARFNYAVVRSDTSDFTIYWISDPAFPSDSIGTRDTSPQAGTFRNAATWE